MTPSDSDDSHDDHHASEIFPREAAQEDFRARDLNLKQERSEALSRYRLEREIARGRAGRVAVFAGRAKHALLVAVVKRVVKPVSEEDSYGKRSVEDAVKDADVLASLSHKHILACAGRYESAKHVWIVMEHCPAGTLRDCFARNGPLASASVKRLALDLLAALIYLHETALRVHGDVAPNNVLLTEHGLAKLCGFWRSRALDDASADFPAVRQVEYASPELLRDASTGTTTASDCWALGCLLREALMGDPPFLCDESQLDSGLDAGASATHRAIVGLLRKLPTKRCTAWEAKELMQDEANRSGESLVA